MRLDAMFSISSKGIDIMKEMEIKRRFDYVLGIDEDDSFTEYMINIGDFGVTSDLFYYLLISPEINLSELDVKGMEELYIDGNFHIFYINTLDVKNLYEKLCNINSDYIKRIFTTTKNICIKPIYSGYESYIEFKEVLEEAYRKNANLLLIMRNK